MKAAGGLQRWRRHGALNTAILLSFAFAVFDVLALTDLVLPGSRSLDRGNPLYWALLMPPMVWGVAASSFSAWTVQLFGSSASACSPCPWRCRPVSDFPKRMGIRRSQLRSQLPAGSARLPRC